MKDLREPRKRHAEPRWLRPAYFIIGLKLLAVAILIRITAPDMDAGFGPNGLMIVLVIVSLMLMSIGLNLLGLWRKR
jgi:hypothetical protein